MKTTRDKSVFNSQQAKYIVGNKAKEFIEYSAKCLDDDGFVDAVNDLLPFDKCVQSKMKMEDDTSIVKSMGLSIMRMELDPPLFSLGVSVEIAGSEGNEATNPTIFIAACRTLEELRAYVRTENFVKQTKENLEGQIDRLILPSKEEL